MKCFRCFGWLLLVVLSSAGHAENKALFIGANKYSLSKGFIALNAAKDAVELGGAFKGLKQGWQVTVVVDEESPNARPITRQAVYSLFGITDTPSTGEIPLGNGTFSGKDKFTPSDNLFVYIGGHGIRKADGVGWKDYFVPTDVQADENGLLMLSSMVELPVIEYALRRSGAGRIIIVSDICREDASSRALSNRGVADGGMRPSSATTPSPYNSRYDQVPLIHIKATGNGTRSFEMQERKRGVFSYFMQAALTNEIGAANKNGDQNLTMLEIFDYSRIQTKAWVESHYRDITQEPSTTGENPFWISDFTIERVLVKKPFVHNKTTTAYVGEEFTFVIDADPSPTAFNASGFPRSFRFERARGRMVGTPTRDEMGTYTITIEAENGAGWGKGTLNLTIAERASTQPPRSEPPNPPVVPVPPIIPNNNAPPLAPQLRFTMMMNDGNQFRIFSDNAVVNFQGTVVGRLVPPGVPNSMGQVAWAIGGFAHLINDGNILVYPNQFQWVIVGRWQ